MAFMKRTERMRSRRGKTPKARRAVPVASSTQRRRAFLIEMLLISFDISISESIRYIVKNIV